MISRHYNHILKNLIIEYVYYTNSTNNSYKQLLQTILTNNSYKQLLQTLKMSIPMNFYAFAYTGSHNATMRELATLSSNGSVIFSPANQRLYAFENGKWTYLKSAEWSQIKNESTTLWHTSQEALFDSVMLELSNIVNHQNSLFTAKKEDIYYNYSIEGYSLFIHDQGITYYLRNNYQQVIAEVVYPTATQNIPYNLLTNKRLECSGDDWTTVSGDCSWTPDGTVEPWTPEQIANEGWNNTGTMNNFDEEVNHEFESSESSIPLTSDEDSESMCSVQSSETLPLLDEEEYSDSESICSVQSSETLPLPDDELKATTIIDKELPTAWADALESSEDEDLDFGEEEVEDSGSDEEYVPESDEDTDDEEEEADEEPTDDVTLEVCVEYMEQEEGDEYTTRYDDSDGGWYTKADFYEYYGTHTIWDAMHPKKQLLRTVLLDIYGRAIDMPKCIRQDFVEDFMDTY